MSSAVTHTRRVQSLYKRALRCLYAWYDHRPRYRYEATLMRARFDQNANLRDFREIEKIVAEGEQELFDKQHPQPRQFPNSPGGVAYERETVPPDWILDYWHPLEKAHYPEYFARREERKKEYLAKWDLQYGKGFKDDHH